MNSKILIIPFFLLLTHFAKAQFNTFILAHDENIEIKVRYKENVSYIDNDFITLFFTNKTKHEINLDSILLTGKNIVASKGSEFKFHFDNEDYGGSRQHDLDTNWVAKPIILMADTTIEKKTNSYFNPGNINDFYVKMELDLTYSFDYQIFKTSNKFIFYLNTIKPEDVEERKSSIISNKR